MFEANNPFLPQARLVVRVLRHVAEEPSLALKGGTAINLFYRELPRLSVDIDLAYAPLRDREQSLAEIGAALRRIARRTEEALPGVRVRREEADRGKLVAQEGRARVTVEVNTVLRGSVFPCERRVALPVVEGLFGDVEAQVLSFEDLFAGKIVLEPREKDIAAVYDREFAQMTAEPIALHHLLDARSRLVTELREGIQDRQREFLRSVKRLAPDWSLLPVPHAPELPGIRWKLHNLEILRRDQPARYAAAVANLEAVLDGFRR
jgi:predicted nucleotidyltransferase component of viral defense system